MKNRIIISRTDSIGDVILTLPMTGILKTKYPECEILFLGRTYTKDIILCSENINQFIDYSEIEKLSKDKQIDYFRNLEADSIIHVFPNKNIAQIAKKAGIKTRIGTSHRWFHYLYCNHRISFSRKKSKLHESELNLKLLKPYSIDIGDFLFENFSTYAAFNTSSIDDDSIKKFINPNKFNLILHPKSKGSAREWNLENYKNLICKLPSRHFHIILTGTEEEGRLFREKLCLPSSGNITDTSGKISLKELVKLISEADALVACSTGPLHIASISNIFAIGLYPPIEPMHPGRWRPIGKNAKVFVKEKKCNICKRNSQCLCINEITSDEISEYLLQIKPLNYD